MCGCGSGTTEAEWTLLNHTQVTGDQSEERNRIDVDIYIDATSSMIGYTRDTSGEYLGFLDQLETTIETGWVQPELNFFKFGSRVREIDRKEYRQARNVSFYQEAGIFQRTNIDRVIDRTDTSRVSIVVTDLFQDNQDMTKIISRIRDRCLRQGIKVGIVGVPSSFDGRVYDARVGPYDYASATDVPSTYRPFYALIFGPSKDLRLLTETLVNQGLIPSSQVLLVTDYLIEQYSGRIERSQQTAGLNMSVNGEGDFNFIMNADVTSANIMSHLALQPYAGAPAFNSSNLRLEVLQGELSGDVDVEDLLRTADEAVNLSLESIESLRDTVRVGLDLTQELPGTFLYRIALEARMPGALQPPEWIREFSSANPSPDSDANKTLNLEPFVQGILDAHATINRPKLALFDVQIRKRD